MFCNPPVIIHVYTSSFLFVYVLHWCAYDVQWSNKQTHPQHFLIQLYMQTHQDFLVTGIFGRCISGMFFNRANLGASCLRLSRTIWLQLSAEMLIMLVFKIIIITISALYHRTPALDTLPIRCINQNSDLCSTCWKNVQNLEEAHLYLFQGDPKLSFPYPPLFRTCSRWRDRASLIAYAEMGYSKVSSVTSKAPQGISDRHTFPEVEAEAAGAPSSLTPEMEGHSTIFLLWASQILRQALIIEAGERQQWNRRTGLTEHTPCTVQIQRSTGSERAQKGHLCVCFRSMSPSLSPTPFGHTCTDGQIDRQSKIIEAYVEMC